MRIRVLDPNLEPPKHHRGGKHQYLTGYDAIDNHAVGSNSTKVALEWIGVNSELENITFSQFKDQSNKFANVLRSLGIGKSDRIFSYMEKLPEHYITVVGALKSGAIAGPIPPTLDPDIVLSLLTNANVKVLVTVPDLREKITPMLPYLIELQHIIVINKFGRDPDPLYMQDLSWEEEMDKASIEFEVAENDIKDISTLHHKDWYPGITHSYQAITRQFEIGTSLLDFKPSDIYFSTTRTGDIEDTVFGMIAPLSNGITQVIVEGKLRPINIYSLIQEYGITNLYMEKTTLNALLCEPEELVLNFDISSLRKLTINGPIDNETALWCRRTFKIDISSSWMQPETGTPITINPNCLTSPPESIGKPLDGSQISVVDDDFNRVGSNVSGHIVVQSDLPSMFVSYWNNQGLYDSRFFDRWYLTEKEGLIDQDGYIFLTNS